MADGLMCFRCGASLADLSLPLSRQDECPSCTVYLHVCKMCEFFDPNVPRQCREDGAEDVTDKEKPNFSEDVTDKEKPNFCDWFKPGYNQFEATRATQASEAKDALATLFDEGETEQAEPDELMSEADKLFK